MFIDSTDTASVQRYSFNGETMGTRYTAVFFAPSGIAAATIHGINEKLFAAVDQVDRQMSTWKPNSALSKLNTAAPQKWLPVPSGLLTVLQSALEINLQSDGAFDIGVGELVNTWGFGPDSHQIPVNQVGQNKKQVIHVTKETLEIDQAGMRVRKLSDVTLDLSGIAKGYGVDELARCLDRLGVTSYLVGIDGEMRARGFKPGHEPWAVALEKPLPGVREVMGVMELCDASIATSGDYRRFVDVAGERYAHTMHPSRGAPVHNRVAAVTVVASSCMLADAWATALLVLGEEVGVKLAQKQGMDVLFVLRDDAGFEEISIVAGQIQAQ
jgi:thiamine biosynthesis lipoprotein